MSRNGSGQYSLPVNSWNPATNGISATAADWQTLIDDVETALTASLAADGQTPMTGNLPMGNNKLTGLSAGTAAGNSLRWEQLFSQGVEADIASATTTDIGAQNTAFLRVTGTTTITGFGTNYNGPRFLRFAGALTLTHGSALVLPGGANITTAAGDVAVAIPKATTGTADGWVVLYQATTSPYALKGANTDITSLSAPALGAATATTQSAGDNTTKLATTAFVNAYAPAASDAVAGKIEIATAAEAIAGTDTVRAITPAGLRSGFNASGTAPVYACRAWVKFNGTGTPAPIASGNVSSITDHGTGDYTVTFTTALPDANYAAVISGNGTSSVDITIGGVRTALAGSCRIDVGSGGTSSAVPQDRDVVSAVFFR